MAQKNLPGLYQINEAPRSELRGIAVEFAEANPLSNKASAGHLAILPCSKLKGVLAKANELP